MPLSLLSEKQMSQQLC